MSHWSEALTLRYRFDNTMVVVAHLKTPTFVAATDQSPIEFLLLIDFSGPSFTRELADRLVKAANQKWRGKPFIELVDYLRQKGRLL